MVRPTPKVNKIPDRPKKIDIPPAPPELVSLILDAAKRVVYGRGEKDYGHPTQNFQEIADLWTVLLGRQLTEPITALQVAQLNIATKLARLINTPDHRDSMIDIAGYAETMARVAKPEFSYSEGMVESPVAAALNR